MSYGLHTVSINRQMVLAEGIALIAYFEAIIIDRYTQVNA
jgi:hypothetical protein